MRNLLSGVGKASLVLGVTGDGVVRDAANLAGAGTAVGVGVDLVGLTVDTDGRVAGPGTGLIAAGDAAGADVDGAGVGGVEVGLDGGLLGLGEAGDALVDHITLVLVGLVDDGLGWFVSLVQGRG